MGINRKGMPQAAKGPAGGMLVAGRSPGARLSHEQIALRARAIWKAKGCPAGEDVRNWHEAEAQLKREMGLR